MFPAVPSGRVWNVGSDNGPRVLKGSLYEDWTEDRPLLRTCIRKGSVAFSELRDVLSDVIELWPLIRPYVRYTGHPHFKSTVDRVSALVLRFIFVGGLDYSGYCDIS